MSSVINLFRVVRLLTSLPVLTSCLSYSISAQEGPSIYERSIRSIVTIEGESSKGSGFLVAPQVIVTNYHVVSGMSEATCYIDNEGARYQIDGFIIADKVNDLVLLKVSELKDKPLTLSPYEAKPGQRIYVIGSPIGLEGTISEGLVSALRVMQGTKKMQISAPTSHGSSGGPVMNINGEVVGVNCSGYDEGENLNFAVPVEQLKKLLAGSSGKVQDLSSLPPIEKDEDDASESDDMGKAELIYRMGIAEKQSPLSLDYLVHFRDSTCLYFTYDLTEAYEKDTVAEYWLSDHRIIDIGSGEVVKALHSNLIASEKNPCRVYRGTKIFYSITFPRLAPSIRNFHLMEGNCDESNYCFRNIHLRDFKTADGMDWATYENPDPEGTVSFFSRSAKDKYTVILGNVNIGTFSEPWSAKSVKPNCGDVGKSVLTARLPIGTYDYKAICGDKTITGEVEVTAQGCLVVELDK
jgi:hypothetical protein